MFAELLKYAPRKLSVEVVCHKRFKNQLSLTPQNMLFGWFTHFFLLLM